MRSTPFDTHRIARSHPPARAVLDGLDALLVPVDMALETSTGIWHASSDCPLLDEPSRKVHFGPYSLPRSSFICPGCGSWRSTPLGLTLRVIDDFFSVDELPCDWPGIAARRRMVVDPFISFPARRDPVFWSALGLHLTGWIESLHAESCAMARELPADALASMLIAHHLCVPTGTADDLHLKRDLDPYPDESDEDWVDRVSPITTWLASSQMSRPRRLTLSKRLADQVDISLSQPSHQVLIVAKDLALFSHGSPVERVVDLYAARSQLSSTTLVAELPPAVLAVLESTPSVAYLDLTARELSGLPPVDEDTLRWASQLYLSAPHRSLAGALRTAERLAH